jgi:hypothetical protein
VGDVRLDVIELGAEAIATVGAADPVELGWVAHSRAIATSIGIVRDHRAKLRRSVPSKNTPDKKASRAISLATSGATGPTPGILHTSPSRTSVHPRLATSWLTSTTSSGRRARPLPVPDSSAA